MIIQIPQIISARTYFLHPGSSDNQRRYNEKKRLNEMEAFRDTVINALPEAARAFTIDLYYSESCRNVTKYFRIFRDGKKTNITWLKNHCKKYDIILKD